MKILLPSSMILLSSLPMVAYPIVILASVAFFRADLTSTPDVATLLRVMYALFCGSLLYLVPYVFALTLTRKELKRGNPRKAALWQLVPISYLAILGVLFVVTMRLAEASEHDFGLH